jgi:DNA polymerase-3 subunit alpha
MVSTAHRHGQPALALTDHGNMGGSVQLYRECKRVGMAPFPGIEAYLTPDMAVLRAKRDKGVKIPRYHIGLVAFTTEGYEALVRLASRMHSRTNFHHKPHVTFSDFAEWSQRGWTEGIALTTGCFFGMVQQTVLEDQKKATRLVSALSRWFPHTYVEFQHHNIDHDGVNDDDIIDALADISGQVGLPIVITQDAHYCHPEEKPLHETLKRLVSWGEDEDDAVFPGDSFHLADEKFVMSHYDHVSQELGIEGLQDLLSKHTLIIPELENYHYNVPVVTAGDPMEEMKGICELEMANLIFSAPHYRERYEEELDVIEFTRMASYLMLVREVTEWCRANGVFFQARGSAAGSLICHLLGVTQLDPLEWNLRYERFLAKDRTKPPDVDLDVEDNRREEMMEWLSSRFSVVQIGTYATYGVSVEEGRGSLLVSYISRKRKNGEDVSHINTILDLPQEDQKALKALSDRGAKKSIGTHAAGLVVTSSRDQIDRLVPTMLVPSSDTTVTQYEMDDVEALGLVKLDVLGLKQLRIIRRTIEMMGRNVHDGLEWIPLDDKETFAMLRKEDTDGVFQLEGWTNRKGCREMKVKTIKDIIVVVALFRPATINSGVKDTYIRRRNGREMTPRRHPMLDKHLVETHGVPVFQEQVISILRDLGFTPEELTEFLKAVKASNKSIGDAGLVVSRYQGRFHEAAHDHGWSFEDIDFAWAAIEGFAEYGFNRAHATQYGLTAYRSAYLKCHRTLEHSTGVLEAWAGTQKEPKYIRMARDKGIRLLKPDVNISGFTWTIDVDKQAIRRGLLSIRGIGEVAAQEISSNAPYASMDDLISRCDARKVNGGKSWGEDGTLKGVLAKLQEAGALKSLIGVR